MPGFEVGDAGIIDGVRWHIGQGHKKVGDKVLYIAGSPTPVRMSLGFLMADFLFENEDLLFPPSEGKEGGKRYLRFLKCAARDGWEVARDRLRAEQGHTGIQQVLDAPRNAIFGPFDVEELRRG